MNFKCKYCGYLGLRKDFELDHVIPISRSLIQNIVNPLMDLICSGCNRQKGKMTSREYILWRLLHPYEKNFGPLK